MAVLPERSLASWLCVACLLPAVAERASDHSTPQAGASDTVDQWLDGNGESCVKAWAVWGLRAEWVKWALREWVKAGWLLEEA